MIRPHVAVGEHKLIRWRDDGILTVGQVGKGISTGINGISDTGSQGA